MTQAILTLLNTITNKPIFQITLCDPVTLFYDNSGTGKTALCNLSERSQTGIYRKELTNLDYAYVLANETDFEFFNNHRTDRILVIADEEIVDEFLDKLQEYIGNPGWYFLIITRDDKNLREIKGVRQVLRRTNGYTAINLPDDRDAVYYEDIPLSIDYMYVEDSKSGVELYDAITMNSAVINEGCSGLGGVEYVSKIICSQQIYDNTVFVFDNLTLNQIHNTFHGYIRECGKRVCLFTPICTEWLLLHSDMFINDSDVQKFLLMTESPDQDKNLEQLALEILKSKNIGYAKEPNHLYWRLLTPSSIKAIGEYLPKPFKEYVQSYTLVGNRHCDINTLVSSIMKEYKSEIAACHPNCEWDKFIKNLVKEHEDITTPDGVLKYINNKAQQTTLFTTSSRTVQEIMRVPSIIYKAIEAGATFPTLEEFLTNKLGDTTSLTDSEIIALLRKTEQTT